MLGPRIELGYDQNNQGVSEGTEIMTMRLVMTKILISVLTVCQALLLAFYIFKPFNAYHNSEREVA